jgi:ATP synthase protein I
MPEPETAPNDTIPAFARNMIHQVAVRVARLKRAGDREYSGRWRAPAIIGLVGWSVVLPMLAGIAIGRWIDRTWPSRHSWTLMLLVGGLLFGCAAAWSHIKREQEKR